MLMLRIERVDYSRFGSALKKAVYVSFPLVLDVRNFIFSKNDVNSLLFLNTKNLRFTDFIGLIILLKRKAKERM